MTQIVIFYEKPGCQGNARQKKMLMDAGVTLVVRDMFGETWKSESLMGFFKNASFKQKLTAIIMATSVVVLFLSSAAVHPACHFRGMRGPSS